MSSSIVRRSQIDGNGGIASRCSLEVDADLRPPFTLIVRYVGGMQNEKEHERFARIGGASCVGGGGAGGFWTVMTERVDKFTINGKPHNLDIVGVFAVGDDDKVRRWREYLDMSQFKEG
jgi:Limonene-1,2-epoxide hydrolase catalytic domain